MKKFIVGESYLSPNIGLNVGHGTPDVNMTVGLALK